MSSNTNSDAAACPVDHKTREAWLEKSRQAQAPAIPSTPVGQSCDSTELSSNPAPLPSSRLGIAREISTIPRASTTSPASSGSPTSSTQASHASRPANSEVESGSSTSGMWIYPSEQMFFAAMKRKGFDAKETDMQSVVPIHNAVNERAWSEIKGWERGRGSEGCGGPKLLSFSGTSTKMTPKAKLNTLLGYQAPFDRHDWIIDRCGTQVEYVIDFYSGKDEKKPGKSLNFYLDVRPKMNSLEGCKMRIGRFLGF